MTRLNIADHHMLIRNTDSYDLLRDIDITIVPDVILFLNIVDNYRRMMDILSN